MPLGCGGPSILKRSSGNFAASGNTAGARYNPLASNQQISQDSGLSGAIPRRYFMENWPPETQNPPRRRAGVPASRGISEDLAVPIFPENLTRCKPFLGDGDALPEFLLALQSKALPQRKTQVWLKVLA
jgi:hypothetical protein